MALMRKSTTARRREVRRSIRERPRDVVGILNRSDLVWSVCLFILFAILAGSLALTGRDRARYGDGETATRAIVARVPFQAIDKAETKKLRQDASDSEANVYKYNVEFFERIRNLLDALIAPALDVNIQAANQIPEDRRKSLALSDRTLQELRRYVDREERVDDSGVAEIISRPSKVWSETCAEFLSDLASTAILQPERARIEANEEMTRAFRITIQHPDRGETERMYSTLYSVEDDPGVIRANITPIANRFGGTVGHSVVEMVMNHLQPTYLFDEDESKQRKDAAFKGVKEIYRDYDREDVLVRTEASMTAFELEVINQERLAYLEELGPGRLLLRQVGTVGVVVVMVFTLWLYLLAEQPRVMRNRVRGAALVALLLLCQSLAIFLNAVPHGFIYATATFPTLLVAIVLAIAYDQRCAFVVGALLSGMVTVSLDLPIGFALTLITGAAVVTALLAEVRTRSKLVQVGITAGAAMAIFTVLTSLVSRPLNISGVGMRIFSDALIVCVTGVSTGMFTQGILPVIERIFGVTTAMTLKELNDASHPLLRRLGEEAPGTYAHSLRMADMSEAAAGVIGANGLLCRVGAMYHDIGKINKPQYFVENQGGGPNRHNRLSPAMSLLIIVGHVKDGIEMAREYGLPKVLRHFIESHHGTTLVEYFYHAAKQRQQGEGKEAPAEFEFRYPGPKPTSREAAIIMLCDGVESAVRSIADPHPARIEQLVHQMATKRLMDGQFDEANITLQDLHKVEESVTKTVCALYHGRIAYPSTKEGEEKQEVSDEASPTPQVADG